MRGEVVLYIDMFSSTCQTELHIVFIDCVIFKPKQYFSLVELLHFNMQTLTWLHERSAANTKRFSSLNLKKVPHFDCLRVCKGTSDLETKAR